MNCQNARRWMSPYLDSELGNTKTFEVSEHLRTCPECTQRFEAERQADNRIRACLEQDMMPDALWAKIARDVSTPVWVQRLLRGRSLALAASIVLILGGTMVAIWWSPATPEPWIVQNLVALSPDNRPFPKSDAAVPDLEATTRQVLGVSIKLRPPAEAQGRHNLEIISVAARTLDDGQAYVEVRLNCCGQPVLLALAKPSEGRPPAEFQALPVEADRTGKDPTGVNVAAKTFPDITAVVASRHPVKQILASLRVTSA